MSKLDTQVGGSHYKTMKIQPLEYCHANNIGKIEGDVIAYVSRWRSKGGIEDLQKAVHELEILIELEQAANSVQVATENLAKEISRIDQQARDVAHLEPEYQPKFGPDKDGWIEWRGGQCPVKSGTRVDIKYRSGDLMVSASPELERWWHGFSPQPIDIVAYMILDEEEQA